MVGDYADASELSLWGRVEGREAPKEAASISQALAVKDLMTLDLSDSMWFNPRNFKPVEADDRLPKVSARHTDYGCRWHDDGEGGYFMATCETPSLVKVLYIDCFVPPWIGTGNVAYKTIMAKDFALKALTLSGLVNRYHQITYQGEPQCVHFGPAGPKEFKVGHMVVKDALGLIEGTMSDAQLPLAQTHPATFCV